MRIDSVELQILTKIVFDKDISLLESVNEDYFRQDYDGIKILQFISEHCGKYGNIPDEDSIYENLDTVIEDLEFLEEVEETDEYLIAELLRLHQSRVISDLHTKYINAVSNDPGDLTNLTLEFADSVQSINELDTSYNAKYDYELLREIDEQHTKEEEDGEKSYISTGFEEIDEDIIGFERGEELVVVYARINNGKSWVAQQMSIGAAKTGNKVGFLTPEMTKKAVAGRVATLETHLSNFQIKTGIGYENIREEFIEYSEEVEGREGHILVASMSDFRRVVTVSKLRSWINKEHLDELVIDGITYLTDERHQRGDTKTIGLTNISEDLMALSEECGIPIVVVVQANRGGAYGEQNFDTPELDNIKDSDGIAANASKAFAVKRAQDSEHNIILLITVKKDRSNEVGKMYKYKWSADTGELDYAPDAEPKEDNDKEWQEHTKKTSKAGKKKKDKEELEDEY